MGDLINRTAMNGLSALIQEARTNFIMFGDRWFRHWDKRVPASNGQEAKGKRNSILPYHLIRALPQVMPAPIAIIAMRSPGLRRPARFASSREIGKDALEVLP
jgi:hypothetical protein